MLTRTPAYTLLYSSEASDLCKGQDLEGDKNGRKLDFLVQELLREANTVGSKASEIATTRAVLEVETEIERIREQVQNLE